MNLTNYRYIEYELKIAHVDITNIFGNMMFIFYIHLTEQLLLSFQDNNEKKK